MNLNRIGGASAGILPPRPEPRRIDPERAAYTPVATPAAPAQRAPLSIEQPKPTLPAEAPAGTDPELWSVLTADERAFFAKVGAMGPLTYGHLITAQTTNSTPIARGGRLDVRA